MPCTASVPASKPGRPQNRLQTHYRTGGTWGRFPCLSTVVLLHVREALLASAPPAGIGGVGDLMHARVGELRDVAGAGARSHREGRAGGTLVEGRTAYGACRR